MKPSKKMKRLIFAIFFILPLVVYGRNFFGFTGANPNIKLKVQLVKESLIKAGYSPKWFTISEKRNKYFNALLPNSAKKSHHLHGNAIDVYVLDIDGDGVFTQKDLDIVKVHTKRVERKNPKLKGAFGTYTTKKFAKRMIHFDTRGYSTSYNH
jgi:uncharacterized protein YcbK (DUF882 family)